MKTYEQLMQEYEQAADHYHTCKLGTKKHDSAGKRLDKTCENLAQFRSDELKRNTS